MSDKNKIYLAALLHDIGKFYQRADVYDRTNNRWQFLDKKRFAESTFCPQYSGKYSHKHVLWTAQFIEEILKIDEKNVEKDTGSLIQLAAKHHAPNSLLQKIITLSDHLSSGMDRNVLTEDAKHEDDWGDYKTTPLLSVFEVVGRTIEKEKYKYRLPVDILKTENIMPVEKGSGYDMEKRYAETWQDFEKEVIKLVNDINDLQKRLAEKNFAETLVFLLEKYTVYIPSSTQNLPDVSLYDHSKTTAAFAVCLHEYLQENPDKNIDELDKNNDTDQPFLLYGADLSGIQKYIYSIKSKNAAKNLKGRSFYLHLVTTTVIKKILDKLDLYRANIIYNSGGGFYMLLPNTDAVKEKLEKIEAEVQEELFNKFGGQIYLATGKQTVSTKKVFDKKINEVWKAVIDDINQSKRQRFAGIIKNDYTRFFEPDDTQPTGERDEITGENLLDDIKTVKDIGKVNQVTYDQIQIGKILKNTHFWHIIEGSWSKKDDEAFEFLGYTHLLRKNIDEKVLDISEAWILGLNNTGIFSETNPKNAVLGFDFYGGNDYPVDEEGYPKPYDKLIDGDYKKLAVVRMDVDNLGYLFANGFTNEQKTFSRYASLSRNLDLFFKGYLNKIWESNQKFKNHTVILYAGGDDLFILGDWRHATDFAEQIRNDFRKYVCENELITLSGGVEFVPPKYPVLKAAEQCEEVEKLGKSYVWKTQKVTYRDKNGQAFETIKQKDAIAFLGTALAWDVEFKEVKDKAKELACKIADNQFPSALLHSIMAFFEMSGKNQQDENALEDKRWIWLMTYQFGRMMQRYKNEKFLDQILNDCLNNTWEESKKEAFNYPSIQLYALAARWAELMVRDHKSELVTKQNKQVVEP